MWSCSNCGETGKDIPGAERHLRAHRQCWHINYSTHGTRYALQKRHRDLIVHVRGQLTGWRRWLTEPDPVATA